MGLRWLGVLAIVPVLIAGHAYAQSSGAARKLRVGGLVPRRALSRQVHASAVDG